MFIYFLNILHFAIYPYIGNIKILQKHHFWNKNSNIERTREDIENQKRKMFYILLKGI